MGKKELQEIKKIVSSLTEKIGPLVNALTTAMRDVQQKVDVLFDRVDALEKKIEKLEKAALAVKPEIKTPTVKPAITTSSKTATEPEGLLSGTESGLVPTGGLVPSSRTSTSQPAKSAASTSPARKKPFFFIPASGPPKTTLSSQSQNTSGTATKAPQTPKITIPIVKPPVPKPAVPAVIKPSAKPGQAQTTSSLAADAGEKTDATADGMDELVMRLKKAQEAIKKMTQ